MKQKVVQDWLQGIYVYVVKGQKNPYHLSKAIGLAS